MSMKKKMSLLLLYCLGIFLHFSLGESTISCPSIYYKKKEAFAALEGTIFNKNVSSPCRDCIAVKGKSLGLNDNIGQQRYTCWQLSLGVASSPLGCATECLSASVSQCTFLRKTTATTSIHIAPQCQSCIDKLPSCSNQLECQSQCFSRCHLECSFPSECTLPDPSQDMSNQSSCKKCMASNYNKKMIQVLGSLWNLKQCLLPIQQTGCREYCVKNCGDGLLGGSEQCDDKNLNNNDGCNSYCNIEAGYECIQINDTTPSICKTICGDGIATGKEECDDNNRIDGDGCSSQCGIEKGYSCTSKDHSTSVCSPVCGDGFITGNETCDDDNQDNGDGCSSTCQIEKGYTCTNEKGKASVCTPICGNKRVEEKEVCDYSIEGSVGCNLDCTKQPGYTCKWISYTSKDTCKAVCGDGLVKGNEKCDLGLLNGVPGSGCSEACMPTNGFTCNETRCSPLCGDGLIIGNEECDTGSKNGGTGCSENCQVEEGAVCAGVPSVCSTTCGDGIRAGKEECDDGNSLRNDGCFDCHAEYGYSCTKASHSICKPVCGDGIRIANEQCDTGNKTMGCSEKCTVLKGYQCTGDIGTRSTCNSVCGDGIVAGDEQCDDGNTKLGDGCNDQCKIEEAPGDNLHWSCLSPGKPCTVSCSLPRVRKAWRDLTATEKKLYIEAIGLAMDSGLYAIFVGIHFESVNDQEAHQTCAFLTWHRRYLVAFENLLRSRGSKYACVTLPYWDYFSDYARFITGQCSGSLQSCAPILNELGGNRGSQQSVNIPGMGTYSGACATQEPANHACPLFSGSWGSGACTRCIPRGSWSSTFPSSAGYASLIRAISSNGFRAMALAIQSGVHNEIHNACGGMLLSMASPADPIFFSHHSTVDMMYQLYFKCKFGRKLSDTEKRTDTNAYEGCLQSGALSGTPLPAPTSRIQMTSYSNGVFMPAETHPLVGQFFTDVGTQHYQFVDASDLGKHSYSYQVGDLLKQLLQQGLVCVNPNYILAEDTGISAKKETPMFLSEPASYSNRYFQWYERTCSKINDNLEARYPDPLERAQEISAQAEYIECLHYDRNHKVTDYSQKFRESFHISYSSHCKQIIDDIQLGRRSISYTNWQRDCNMLNSSNY